jgi:hypothetical protein
VAQKNAERNPHHGRGTKNRPDKLGKQGAGVLAAWLLPGIGGLLTGGLLVGGGFLCAVQLHRAEEPAADQQPARQQAANARQQPGRQHARPL